MGGGDHSVLATMVQKGFLGKKTGKGFYMYPKDAKKGDARQVNPELTAILKDFVTGKGDLAVEDIQMRMISRFVNEAAYCLQDGIIRAPVDGDIGAVFGIGFPPFMGGPFRMLDLKGVGPFVDRMLRYRDLKGPQFEPCQLLKDYAASGKKFYPSS
jgi:enoyl-CoA hydratase/long-chain 3-hydroxyacyl-CoA dehydrogenase